MTLQRIDVEGWKTPSDYSNGMLAPAGARMLAVAGQVAWDAQQQIVGRGDFAAQFRQVLSNVVDIVRAAGGKPTDLMSLTIFVLDKDVYIGCTRQLGVIWKELVGRHYPAMALVQVANLLEEGALLEIQALAAIAPQ